MEQKTAEEILREKQIEYNNSIGASENNMNDEEWKETLADTVFQSLVNAMQDYAKQQQEIAVEKALEMASSEVEFIICTTTYKKINKNIILSLKPEILKELEK